MEFRILGPLEVVDDLSRIVEIAGRKPRALLVLLLLNANTRVSVSRLIDELWGEEPPANAAKAVQVYVSRLRKALQGSSGERSPERIRTGSRGYAIAVEPGELDLERFTALAEEGSRALVAKDPEAASARLARALDLWRGPPLEEFAEEPFASELGRLEELRLAVVEQRIEADLALGRHAALIPELADLVHRHPFRERLLAQLMLALARSGRQADALAAYQEGRAKLIYDLGIEPGAHLRELERAILEQREFVSPRPAEAPVPAPPQTPATEGVDVTGESGESARRRRLLPGAVLGALAVAAAATAVVLGVTGGEGAGSGSTPPNALVAVEPETVRVRAAAQVGDDPGFVAVGEGAVWVASLGDRTLSRVDPETGSVTKTIGLGFTPGGLAAGEGAVWVSDPENGTLHRLNAFTGDPERRVELGSGGAGPIPVAIGQGSVWAANSNAFRLFRIDPETGRIVGRFELDAPRAIHVSEDAVWVLEGSHSLAELDPGSARIARVALDFTPGGLAVGAGAVWTTDPDEDVVWRFDARTRSAERTISVGQEPTGVAFGHDAAWVANAFDGTVSKVDPAESRVVATVPVGERAAAIAAGSGGVWVAVTEP